MAFCQNCGTVIPEGTNEAFCGTCGHPIEAATPESAPKKSKGKGIGIIATCIVVVAALVVGAFVFLGSSYKDPLNSFMKAVNKREEDSSKIVAGIYGKKFGKYYLKTIEAQEKLYDEDESSDELEELYEAIEDEFGDDWKISFEYKKSKKIKFKDLEEEFDFDFDDYMDDLDEGIEYYEELLDDDDEIEEYAEYFDASEKAVKEYLESQIAFMKAVQKMDFKQVYEVKGKFIVKADGDKYESESVTLYFGKTNGTWVYLGAEDEVEFEDDDEELLAELVNWYFIYNSLLD